MADETRAKLVAELCKAQREYDEAVRKHRESVEDLHYMEFGGGATISKVADVVYVSLERICEALANGRHSAGDIQKPRLQQWGSGEGCLSITYGLLGEKKPLRRRPVERVQWVVERSRVETIAREIYGTDGFVDLLDKAGAKVTPVEYIQGC